MAENHDAERDPVTMRFANRRPWLFTTFRTVTFVPRNDAPDLTKPKIKPTKRVFYP
jgi:hypothetical protein